MRCGTNTVMVNGATAYHKGEYFWDELSLNNSAAPVWEGVTVAATGQSTVSGNVFVPKTPEAFSYDADGNLLSDGRWNYTWDGENRLIQMVPATSVGPQQLIKFEYDWQGRRIRKQVWDNTSSSGSPALDERFLYDGWNLVAVLSPQSSVLASFIWGNDLSGSQQGAGGVGGLLEVSASGTNCFVAFDGNGNVVALVNATDGNVVANYEYGPFGELIRQTGPMAKCNPFRFSTKYQDDESDLLYYGYRYCDPSTGRWLSRDPAEEDGGANLYGFVGNSSISGSDYLGLWKIYRYNQPRADAFAECGDTIRTLAERICLDPNQWRKWLQVKVTVNNPLHLDTPLVGGWFTIPNIVYVNRVGIDPFWIVIDAHLEKAALLREGFNAIYRHDIDNDALRQEFGSADIYGLVNIAHGEEELYGHGEIETADPRGLGLFAVKTVLHHKLGGLKVIQCWGGAINWRHILGPGAYYWAPTGKIDFFDSPPAGF